MNNAKKETTKIKRVQIIEPSNGKPRIILTQKDEQTVKYSCSFCPESYEKMIDLGKHHFHSQNDTNQQLEDCEIPQNNH